MRKRNARVETRVTTTVRCVFLYTFRLSIVGSSGLFYDRARAVTPVVSFRSSADRTLAADPAFIRDC